jgi:hypothetical protein
MVSSVRVEDRSPDGSDLGRVDRPVEVEVAVLGPVEVRGAARPFRRAGALDLVVFLAVHPRGASTEVWATALWPERLMAPPTMHSVASAARRALGRSAAGEDHLPRRRGRLQLAPTVGTDWSRFTRLADGDGPGHWRAALDLVRGRPYEGLGSPDWVVLEGFASAAEDAVVSVAAQLSDHLLAAGDPLGAARAARRGLRASPYDERLYRRLLRAADAAGHPAGVEAAMAELLRLVGRVVHPRTAALYRMLSRRPPDSGGPPPRL